MSQERRQLGIWCDWGSTMLRIAVLIIKPEHENVLTLLTLILAVGREDVCHVGIGWTGIALAQFTGIVHNGTGLAHERARGTRTAHGHGTASAENKHCATWAGLAFEFFLHVATDQYGT